MKLGMIDGIKEIDTKDIKLVKTMSSLEIAKLTDKRHDHVLRDIRNIEKELGEPISGGGYYKDANQQDRPMLLLDKENTLLLVSGYSVKLRQAIIRRWLELEGSLLRNIQDKIQLIESEVNINGTLWGKAGVSQRRNRKVLSRFDELLKSDTVQELELFNKE